MTATISLPAALEPRSTWLLTQVAAAAGLRIGDGPELAVDRDWDLESAFDHLSRREELNASVVLDEHGRFPASATSLGPDDRPVDDLVALVCAAAEIEPAPTYPRAARFGVVLTHDIDTPWRWTTRGIVGAASRLKHAAQKRDVATVKTEALGLSLLPFHKVRRSDPNWAHSRFGAIEAARGFRSTSFVIGDHRDPHDGAAPEAYAKRRGQLIAELLEHGEVAQHSSYTTGADLDLLARERGNLEAWGAKVAGNRHHYLRLPWHDGTDALDRAGFSYDASLGYAERPGARAGFSFPFQPWSFKREAPLDLLEIPLVLMDATLAESRYLELSPDAAWPVIEHELDRLADVGGCASVLWHNDRFDRVYGRGWDKLYARLLDGIVVRGGCAGTGIEFERFWRSERL